LAFVFVFGPLADAEVPCRAAWGAGLVGDSLEAVCKVSIGITLLNHFHVFINNTALLAHRNGAVVGVGVGT
jgi:hypothetical protein